MKPQKLLPLLAMLLCLTFGVVAQQTPPGQPVISLDFAQYCVGNNWKFKLSNGVPNTSMRLLGTSNGQSWEVTDWPKTDRGGGFTEEGTFAAEAVGSHTLKLDIGGIRSNTLSFVVSECPVKGGLIAFVSTRDGGGPPAGYLSVPYIYVANADGSDVRRLTQGEWPTWSGDGQRIAFHKWSSGAASSGPAEIRVMNADGSNERVLGPGFFPSWSPDGAKIAFFSGVGGPEGGIFMMNADGSSVARLVSNNFANPGWGDYAVQRPSWSPDGRGIAFVRANYEDPWTVHILDLATSEISFLRVGFTENESRSVMDSRPAWSPDGTRLLLQIGPIASINRNGSGLQIHVQPTTYLGNPDWSPDGRSIVFNKFSAPGDQVSSLGSRMRIFIARLEDSSVRQLIPEAVAPSLPDYWDSQPAWSRVRQ
jgi:Tol biopolymer transport system component